jgi:GntR family transcriptional regulator, transcriptional repressor for pyruvate dehydrogenase complex
MNLKKTNLSDLVVKRIREYIEINDLKVGDRLPTEQEMATMFGVSRISIREATKALNFLGIIRAAPRRGLTVGPVDMEKMNEILGFHFMLDNFPKDLLLKARLVIEIGSLQYAMHAVASDTLLYKKLITMCDNLDQTKDASQFLKIDVTFHRTLVEASKITPLIAFHDVISAFFQKFRSELLFNVKNFFPHSSIQHREIVLALHDGKLIDAENIMRRHLEAFNEPKVSE